MRCRRRLRGGEARAKGQGSHEIQRGGNRIRIVESIEGANPPWTSTGDATTNVERVASGTSDLADVISHKEVGVVDGHVVGLTKEGRVWFTVDHRPFVVLPLCRPRSTTMSTPTQI